MSDYPVDFADPDGTVKMSGTLSFTNPELQPGAHWYDGGGPPSDSYGVNGDYYLDDDDGSVYRKDNGTWQ